jgi:hypothetical protein
MAELTYDDVRRAVQTISTNLQSVISDIRNNLQNTRTDISRLNPNNDFQYRLVNIERTLTEVTQFMQRVDVGLQNSQPIVNTIQQSQMRMQRLEQRLANLEQLSTDMSHYLQAMHDATQRLSNLQIQALERAEP